MLNDETNAKMMGFFSLKAEKPQLLGKKKVL